MIAPNATHTATDKRQSSSTNIDCAPPAHSMACYLCCMQVSEALQQLQVSVPDDEEAMLSDEQEEALETALSALRVAATLCGELLQECHAAPPEALANTAIQLHDHALLVGGGEGGRASEGGGGWEQRARGGDANTSLLPRATNQRGPARGHASS